MAANDPEHRRKIATKGGRASYKSGNGHALTEDDARKGGKTIASVPGRMKNLSTRGLQARWGARDEDQDDAARNQGVRQKEEGEGWSVEDFGTRDDIDRQKYPLPG